MKPLHKGYININTNLFKSNEKFLNLQKRKIQNFSTCTDRTDETYEI